MTPPMSCITKQTRTRSAVYGLRKATRKARRGYSHWQDSMGFHSSECKRTSEYFFDDTLFAGKLRSGRITDVRYDWLLMQMSIIVPGFAFTGAVCMISRGRQLQQNAVRCLPCRKSSRPL